LGLGDVGSPAVIVSLGDHVHQRFSDGVGVTDERGEAAEGSEELGPRDGASTDVVLIEGGKGAISGDGIQEPVLEELFRPRDVSHMIGRRR